MCSRPKWRRSDTRWSTLSMSAPPVARWWKNENIGPRSNGPSSPPSRPAPDPGWREVSGSSDGGGVSEAAERGAAGHLLELYDDALPEVYGYLLHRCGDVPTAQDLTSETFVAAARTIQSGHGGPGRIASLICGAPHKLIDHRPQRA